MFCCLTFNTTTRSNAMIKYRASQFLPLIYPEVWIKVIKVLWTKSKEWAIKKIQSTFTLFSFYSVRLLKTCCFTYVLKNISPQKKHGRWKNGGIVLNFLSYLWHINPYRLYNFDKIDLITKYCVWNWCFNPCYITKKIQRNYQFHGSKKA